MLTKYIDPTDDCPGDLLTAMLAAPVGHPSRQVLRDQAIEAWLPLAHRLARRYSGRGVPVDDLVQTATVGLIKAVDRFVGGYSAGFAGYAIPTILGELKRHFRDQAWMIRVPRRLQELRLAITAANVDLAQRIGRSPTVADIATYLGLTEETVLEGLEGTRAYRPMSLSTPVHFDGSSELGDTLGEDDCALAQAEARIALVPAMATLDDRERQILILRFYGNLTQSDIAEKMGISQMHVSRLIAHALATLRRRLDSEGQQI